MPAAAGGRAARRDEEDQAEIERLQAGGPWGMAAGMVYDDIIDPRELRNALLDGLALAEGRLGSPAAEER